MVQIKVTPEMLEGVAKRAYGTRHALESIHKNLCDQIDHLCYQWTGASNQNFVQMFDDAKPKAFTFINGIANVEEELKQIAEKFRTADTSYDGNLVDGKVSDDNIEEGATCGPLNSEKKDDKKDESLLDKFKHGVEDVYEEYSKIKDFVDDKVEDVFEKAGLGAPYHFKKGMEEAIGDELLGLADAVIHPIDTLKNTAEALSDPVGTFNALKQTISDSWNNDVVNGDWNSRAAWYGSASAHTILAVGQLFVGTKGVDKIAMLNYGTKLSEVSQTAKQGAASLFNRNHKEFAIAGGGGLRFGLDTPDFKQAEEKLSTHQFANSGGNTNAIKPGDTSPLAPGGGLIAHEAKPGQRRGGHLIKKHVGKTDAELLQRLQNDPRIPASSSFTNRAIAERVANEVLSNPQNIAKINRWLNNPNTKPTLALRYNGNSILGRYVERGSNGALDVENAVIVLKKDNQGSFIITGYPEK
ncbi:WXG100 family type VII secretion target [Bacillus arachidis]|uniref:WXG100 family type VII secretion target n=1 Tax=Bacillus arachidis TaxID=2819290 RepID=A0ABS3NTK7_9BACI|nr:WXG100 family type VII secretion target [Bacillus arachidis]MBO1624220.1 WXG100 family type VII secretion target [Bacillus arachidis]